MLRQLSHKSRIKSPNIMAIVIIITIIMKILITIIMKIIINILITIIIIIMTSLLLPVRSFSV